VRGSFIGVVVGICEVNWDFIQARKGK